MQRFPPQIGPIGPAGSGQSAFVAQGCAALVLQVSQKHFRLVNPGARQLGLEVASVRETVPVEFERSIGNAAICAPEVGGQSRLVAPKNTFGDEPFTSQLWPLFTPESQVPPRTRRWRRPPFR